MEMAWPLLAVDLALCGNLKTMGGRFVEVCRRRGLKVTANKSKVMVLGEEEGLISEIVAGGERLGYVLDKSGADGAKCCRKVVRGMEVDGAIPSTIPLLIG